MTSDRKQPRTNPPQTRPPQVRLADRPVAAHRHAASPGWARLGQPRPGRGSAGVGRHPSQTPFSPPRYGRPRRRHTCRLAARNSRPSGGGAIESTNESGGRWVPGRVPRCGVVNTGTGRERGVAKLGVRKGRAGAAVGIWPWAWALDLCVLPRWPRWQPPGLSLIFRGRRRLTLPACEGRPAAAQRKTAPPHRLASEY